MDHMDIDGATASRDVKLENSENSGLCQAITKNGKHCKRCFRMSHNSQLLCRVHYNVIKKQEDRNETCAICLENMQSSNNGPVMKLGCCHSFHVSCLKSWCFQGKDSCPMCRADIDSDSLIRLNKDVINHIGKVIYTLPSHQRRIMLYNIDRAMVTSMAGFFPEPDNTTSAPASLDVTPGPEVTPVIQVYHDTTRGYEIPVPVPVSGSGNGPAAAPPRDPRLRQRNNNISYDVYPMLPLDDDTDIDSP